MSPRCLKSTCCLLLFLLSACSKSERETEAAQQELASRLRMQADGTIVLSAQEQAAIHLAVVTATPVQLATGRVVYGRVGVSPTAQVQVSAPITGTLEGGPLAGLGSVVAAGTPLLRLAPALETSERTSLGVQAAEIDGRIGDLEHQVAEKDAAAERARKLAPERILSVAKLQALEADAASAHAQLAGARREREALRNNASRAMVVRSPIAGTVAALTLASGATVKQGDPLATILGPGGRWVDVGVAPSEPRASSYAIRIGSAWVPASLLGSGAVASADGLRHDLLALPAMETAPVPGALVPVRLSVGPGEGVSVPPAAVVPTAQGDVVFIEVAAGRYRSRPVHVADRGAESVQIDRGVAAGARLVARGATELWGEVVKARGASGQGGL